MDIIFKKNLKSKLTELVNSIIYFKSPSFCCIEERILNNVVKITTTHNKIHFDVFIKTKNTEAQFYIDANESQNLSFRVITPKDRFAINHISLEQVRVDPNCIKARTLSEKLLYIKLGENLFYVIEFEKSIKNACIEFNKRRESYNLLQL